MIMNSIPDAVELSKFNRKGQFIDPETGKSFEGIVELALQVCDSPIALIYLTDEKRQWVKASKGVEVNAAHLDFLFSELSIQGGDALVVNDTLADQRFYRNSYVINEPIRFYAGVPIIAESGRKLGTLCVMDTRPKVFSDCQLSNLRTLASQVTHLLGVRLKNLQLQKLVQDKTSELSHFFDRIGDAFISLDKNWNYVYANKQLGDLVQRDPSQLIGKNVWEEFPEAINSATYHAFHQAMREQRYICHLDYFEPLDLWQENHIYPTPDGLSVFIRDVSASKRSEKKLIQSIETLERAEEQAKMGSWQLDVATGKRHWSKQLFLMFGFDPTQEIPPREVILQRVHPEDRASYLILVEQLMKDEDPDEIVLRTNPLTLPLRHILVYTRKVKDERGITLRFEGIMIDVTELQKTYHELDQFVYSVSHDLRSPLASILGLLNVAELEKPDTPTAPHLKRIREQVNRLDYFIKEILEYSMNARTEAHFEKIDFPFVIEEVKSNLKPLTEIDRLKLHLATSGNHEFFTDKARLEIILKNLLSNSIKYQDFKKNSCTISINVETTPAQSKIIFADNGIGIEKIHLTKIFDMFYRATEHAKGAGLGLYIVKEAVHKLGGRIKAESELGAGTVFEIVLPNFLAYQQP